MTTIALITGGNRGLGFETARRLAEAGVTPVIGARDAGEGDRAARALRADGHRAEAVVLDVRSREQIEAAAHGLAERHGQLDVLVNNAGIAPEAAAIGEREPVDADLFRETYETNVFGPVRVIEALLPLLRRAPSAHIVNVSSTMGSLTDASDPRSPYYAAIMPAYSSSKGALNGITVALAKALKGDGIRVTSVCPGFVQTDLTPVNREQAPTTAEEASRVVATVALGDATGPSGRFVDGSGVVLW